MSPSRLRSCFGSSWRNSSRLAVLTMALAGYGHAATIPCDEGQLIGLQQQNAHVVICSATAQQLPELVAAVSRLSSLVERKGPTSRDTENFITALNGTARSVPGHSDEMLRALAKYLSQRRSQSDLQIAHQLVELSQKLQQLQTRISHAAENPATQSGMQAALRGGVGDAVARLDVTTASQLLDSLEVAKKQIAGTEVKEDQANHTLNQILAQSDCSLESAVDAIRTRDAARTLRVRRCDGQLLHSYSAALQFCQLFANSEEFHSAQGYLESLRRGGFNFVRDLQPKSPDSEFSNRSTPVFVAARDADIEALKWLLQDSGGNTLESYHALVPALVPQLVYGPSDDDGAWLQALRLIVTAGAPVSGGNYSSYRTAIRRYAPFDGAAARGSEQMPPRDAAFPKFLRQLAEVVAPPSSIRVAFDRQEAQRRNPHYPACDAIEARIRKLGPNPSASLADQLIEEDTRCMALHNGAAGY